MEEQFIFGSALSENCKNGTDCVTHNVEKAPSEKDSPKSQSKTLLCCMNYSRGSDYEVTSYIP